MEWGQPGQMANRCKISENLNAQCHTHFVVYPEQYNHGHLNVNVNKVTLLLPAEVEGRQPMQWRAIFL